MRQKNKVPKRGVKRYKHAYNKGYRAGLEKASISGTVKISKITGEPRVFTAEPPAEILPVDSRVYKWQGFTEAMNLIIASKRG